MTGRSGTQRARASCPASVLLRAAPPPLDRLLPPYSREGKGQGPIRVCVDRAVSLVLVVLRSDRALMPYRRRITIRRQSGGGLRTFRLDADRLPLRSTVIDRGKGSGGIAQGDRVRGSEVWVCQHRHAGRVISSRIQRAAAARLGSSPRSTSASVRKSNSLTRKGSSGTPVRDAAQMRCRLSVIRGSSLRDHTTPSRSLSQARATRSLAGSRSQGTCTRQGRCQHALGPVNGSGDRPSDRRPVGSRVALHPSVAVLFVR